MVAFSVRADFGGNGIPFGTLSQIASSGIITVSSDHALTAAASML